MYDIYAYNVTCTYHILYYSYTIYISCRGFQPKQGSVTKKSLKLTIHLHCYICYILPNLLKFNDPCISRWGFSFNRISEKGRKGSGQWCQQRKNWNIHPKEAIKIPQVYTESWASPVAEHVFFMVSMAHSIGKTNTAPASMIDASRFWQLLAGFVFRREKFHL